MVGQKPPAHLSGTAQSEQQPAPGFVHTAQSNLQNPGQAGAQASANPQPGQWPVAAQLAYAPPPTPPNPQAPPSGVQSDDMRRCLEAMLAAFPAGNSAPTPAPHIPDINLRFHPPLSRSPIHLLASRQLWLGGSNDRHGWMHLNMLLGCSPHNQYNKCNPKVPVQYSNVPPPMSTQAQ